MSDTQKPIDLRGYFRAAKDINDYAPGTTIFTEGEPGEIMFAILEGEVEIRVQGALIETLHEGDLLGEMAVIDPAPRSASAIAKTACKLVPIDERRFLFLVQQTPYFALYVMRILARRLRAVNTIRLG